jgi:hypothetical protein
MTFLTGSLLFGALALSVPLIIHLLHRNRSQTVPWAAMHLLELPSESSRISIQWREWLLLALRCIIPVILALLLARPVITNFIGYTGGVRQSIVIVVDNSYSMARTNTALNARPDDASSRGSARESAYASQSNDARPNDALKIAQQLKTQLSAKHSVSIQPMIDTTADASQPAVPGGRPRFGPSIRPTDAADLAWRSMLPSVDSLRTDQELGQQIIVISDFRSSDWQNRTQAMETLGSFETLSNPLGVWLLPIQGRFQNDPVKIGLEQVPKRSTVFENQPVQIQCTVFRAASRSPADMASASQNCMIEILQDNKLVSRNARQFVDGTQRFAFSVAFSEPGDHEIQVSLRSLPSQAEESSRGTSSRGNSKDEPNPDETLTDSPQHIATARLGVRILDTLDVLYLDARAPDAMDSAESQFSRRMWQLAIDPEMATDRAIRVRRFRLQLGDPNGGDFEDANQKNGRPDSLTESLSNNPYAVFVHGDNLSNESLIKRLAAYASAGGHVVLVPSELPVHRSATQPNRPPFSNFESHWMPAMPFAYQFLSSTGQPETREPDQFQLDALISPVLARFQRDGVESLAAVRVTTRYRLQANATPAQFETPSQALNALPNSSVLVSSQQNEPLIVQSRIGDGLLTQFAFDIDARWTNFASRPVFPAFVQQILLEPMRSTENLSNYVVGNVPKKIIQDASVSIRDLWSEGKLEVGGKPIYLQVNANEIEQSFQPDLDSTTLEPAITNTIGDNGLVHVAADPYDLLANLSVADGGVEVWRTFLVLLLILLFVEILLVR